MGTICNTCEPVADAIVTVTDTHTLHVTTLFLFEEILRGFGRAQEGQGNLHIHSFQTGKHLYVAVVNVVIVQSCIIPQGGGVWNR